MDDEGRKVVKYFYACRRIIAGTGCKVTVVLESEASHSVTATAVTRKTRALFGIIGRKGHVGGFASLV